MNLVEEPSAQQIPLSRRNLIRNMVAGAVATAAATAFAGCGGSGTSSSSTPAASASSSDEAILNFALNLEYLEAEFYTYATTGAYIEANPAIGTTGVGASGPSTGGTKTTFTIPGLASVAAEITEDEQSHVILLRQALGAAAVAKPAINLAALGPFTTDAEFLTLGRAFEDTGVSAYGGAATSISSKAYLQTAAQILGVEAFHASALRLFIAQNGITVKPTDAFDVVPPPAGTLYFTTTNPATGALAVIRTPAEVLNIVYAGGTTSGGFFPNGVNGSITTA